MTQCPNPLLMPSPRAQKREKIKAMRREKQCASKDGLGVLDLEVDMVSDANVIASAVGGAPSPRAQKRERIKASRREKQRASKKRQSATKAQALEPKVTIDKSAIDASDGKLVFV